MYQVYCDNTLIYDTSRENLKIFEPVLNLEVNKTGSFQFVIYPEHPNYNDIEKLSSMITVYQNDELIFRGRVLNDEKGFYNQKTVDCEGELAFLVDSIQRPYEFQGTPAELFTQLITNHNSQVDESKQFIVGNITVTDPNDYITRSDTQYLNTWDSINEKLIDKLGGYLHIRHEAGGVYIDYLADLNFLGTQTIEFAKNLIDIKRSAKGEEIATAVIPLGAKNEDSEERLTIKSVNDDVDYVYDQDAVDAYGWIFVTNVWDDVTEATNLKRKGEQYLADKINTISSIELNAVDMAGMNSTIESFKCGTYVRVTTNPHSIDQTFLIEKMTIKLDNPTGNTLTLNASFKSFLEQSKEESAKVYETVRKEISDTKSKVEQEVTQVVASSIEQSSNQILQTVSNEYYKKGETDQLVESVSTELAQTANGWDFRFNGLTTSVGELSSGTETQFNEIKKYIHFVDGNIVLGEAGNELILRIQNDKIVFLENNYEVAYWQNRKFYAVDGEFITSLKLGKFAFIPRTNGNLSFKKVVD